MTIELDTTLAQAEVLFLSFSQLVADIDRRRAEGDVPSAEDMQKLRNRKVGAVTKEQQPLESECGTSTARKASVALPSVSSNLRELLEASNT